MDELKTGRLLTLPLLCALALTGNEKLQERFEQVGRNIGIAFQIQDDILDVIAEREQLGKSTSDQINEKSTYVSLLGLSEAEKKVSELFSDVYKLLDGNYPETAALIEKIEKRTW
jgi:geranylgeranyl diphosphate synthase type II